MSKRPGTDQINSVVTSERNNSISNAAIATIKSIIC